MKNEKLSRMIADNLRQIRAKKRISQDKLAEMCEISQQYICKIETEKVNPSISILVDIANALDITLNDLVY